MKTLINSFALTGKQRWHVAHTHQHKEVGAGSQLENQGFRVFVPRRAKSRRHARRIDTVLAPLFPRYLFVIIDTSCDRWRAINGTYGVISLIMEGERPKPVPHGIVESLILRTNQSGQIAFDPLTEAERGRSVRVMAGPFADQIGLLERLDDSGMVKLLLEIMGGKVPVQVPGTNVMLAEKCEAAV